jgi:hypothetical protein
MEFPLSVMDRSLSIGLRDRTSAASVSCRSRRRATTGLVPTLRALRIAANPAAETYLEAKILMFARRTAPRLLTKIVQKASQD